MPATDPTFDEEDQTLGRDVRMAFDDLSLSPSQRKQIQERFRQYSRRRERNRRPSSANALRDEFILGETGTSTASTNSRASGGRSRTLRGLERAAVLIVLLLFVGGIFFTRTLLPRGSSSQPGAGTPKVTTVYAVKDSQNEQQLLPLDPTSLASQSGNPITLSNPAWAISADGSTLVSIDYEQGISYIVVRDGFRGTERARFKSPIQGLLQSLQLSQDGTRLLVNRKLEPSQWAVIDTQTGELLMSLQGSRITFGFATPMSAEDIRLSPDGKRVYRFIFNSSADPTGSSALRVVSYDVTSGRQNGSLTLPEVQVGTWPMAQSSTVEPIIYFLQPGIAISPDNKQIAIASPGGKSVTMIDATKLTFERRINLAQSSGFIDRLLTVLGMAPEHAEAKTLDGVLREAVFSPDGQALYTWGQSDSATGASGMQALPLERIDLAAGKITDSSANTLPQVVIQHVEPAPDGTSLYVLGYSPSSNPQVPSPTSIWRLNARTLQAEASQPADGVYGIALVTGETPSPTGSPVSEIGIAPWPAQTDNPDGLSLQLSKSSVTPGELLTRTIAGSASHSEALTNDALMLDARVNGSWRTIYYLGFATPPEPPSVSKAGPGVAMCAVGVGPKPAKFRILDLAPGTYRLRQDLSSGSAAETPIQVTLYATITVVAP